MLFPTNTDQVRLGLLVHAGPSHAATLPPAIFGPPPSHLASVPCHSSIPPLTPFARQLVTIPTALTVDAFVTPPAGIRKGADHTVEYVGTATPDPLVIDFDLLRTAPGWLNVAGVGDILSCHTACVDWELAHAAGRRCVPTWPVLRLLLRTLLLRPSGVHPGASGRIRVSIALTPALYLAQAFPSIRALSFPLMPHCLFQRSQAFDEWP